MGHIPPQRLCSSRPRDTMSGRDSAKGINFRLCRKLFSCPFKARFKYSWAMNIKSFQSIWKLQDEEKPGGAVVSWMNISLLGMSFNFLVRFSFSIGVKELVYAPMRLLGLLCIPMLLWIVPICVIHEIKNAIWRWISDDCWAPT